MVTGAPNTQLRAAMVTHFNEETLRKLENKSAENKEHCFGLHLVVFGVTLKLTSCAPVRCERQHTERDRNVGSHVYFNNCPFTGYNYQTAPVQVRLSQVPFEKLLTSPGNLGRPIVPLFRFGCWLTLTTRESLANRDSVLPSS